MSQESLEPLALRDSYQVVRTEFLEHSVVLVLINLPLVINPVVAETAEMLKLTNRSLEELQRGSGGNGSQLGVRADEGPSPTELPPPALP